jgi:cbb3-type cytochrome oxidase subunit 3
MHTIIIFICFIVMIAIIIYGVSSRKNFEQKQTQIKEKDPSQPIKETINTIPAY